MSGGDEVFGLYLIIVMAGLVVVGGVCVGAGVVWMDAPRAQCAQMCDGSYEWRRDRGTTASCRCIGSRPVEAAPATDSSWPHQCPEIDQER